MELKQKRKYEYLKDFESEPEFLSKRGLPMARLSTVDGEIEILLGKGIFNQGETKAWLGGRQKDLGNLKMSERELYAFWLSLTRVVAYLESEKLAKENTTLRLYPIVEFMRKRAATQPQSTPQPAPQPQPKPVQTAPKPAKELFL